MGSTFKHLLLWFHELNQVDNTGGIAKFIVVPRNQLNEIFVQSNTSLRVENWRVSITDKILRDNLQKDITFNWKKLVLRYLFEYFIPLHRNIPKFPSWDRQQPLSRQLWFHRKKLPWPIGRSNLRRIHHEREHGKPCQSVCHSVLEWLYRQL